MKDPRSTEMAIHCTYTTQITLVGMIIIVCFFMWVVLSNTTPLNLERRRSNFDLSHDQSRHMIMRSKQEALEFPLTFNSDIFIPGIFTAKLKIGSPPKEFRVAVDSGSDEFWITCPPSNFSGNIFDPNKSTSVSMVPCSDRRCLEGSLSSELHCDAQNRCSYSVTYADFSHIDGFLVSDFLSTTNLSTRILFGCSNSISNSFAQQNVLDGILGLGKGSLSLLSQLGTPRIFSHCLSANNLNRGSWLLIGEFPQEIITYTPLLPSQYHYNVNLSSISFGEKTLKIDPSIFMLGGGTIVDSGSSFIHLYEAVFKSFIPALVDSVAHSANRIDLDGFVCFTSNSSSSIIDVFPRIHFYFAGGAALSIDPSEYLSLVNDTHCLRIFESSYATILGEIILMDKIMVYDVDGKKVGWRKANCSTETPKVQHKNFASRSCEYIFETVTVALILDVLVLLSSILV